MSERSKFIKVRVSVSEYKALRQRADARGVTMSEHVRTAVTEVHQAQDVAAELAALRQHLGQVRSAPVNDAGTEQREMLLRCCCYCANWQQHVTRRFWEGFARSWQLRAAKSTNAGGGMRTHDAFLRYLLGAADRALVWTVLAIVLSGLTWTAIWERGLGLPALDGWRVLGLALLGRTIDRTALTLLLLSTLVGVMGATLVGGWLFRRWRRRAELDVVRLRGARWDGDQ